jgi:23S rRNA pseudouridine1911/1915/1917 synthase
MEDVEIEFEAARRLDQQIVQMYPELTRGYVGRLIDDGKVQVNGEVVLKAGYKPKLHDEITVDYDIEKSAEVPEIDLPILYDDDDCVVIDKPLGVLAHSKGAYNPEATVATWLASRVTDIPAGERAGIVHRLDRATSGVMICAKNAEALSWLQKQFSNHRVKKTYNAVIVGTMNPGEAIIDMAIERNPKKPQTFRVGHNGKPAQTHYKVVQSNDTYSLVELKPTTGRTHQLRVHLAQQGHPIVGDVFYDGESAERLYLHACELELTLPNRERKVFTSPLPEEFNAKVA